MLSDHYFGDVEAIDEGKNHPSYFKATFILPSSFSISSLNNRSKFIIVGRKGSGKTAIQFHFARELEEKGFLTHFFSFYDDLKPSDYNNAATTQKIDTLGIKNLNNIFLNYDFREVWERTFLIKIAEQMRAKAIDSKFVKFALGDRSRLASIFEGFLKSTNVRLSAEMGTISAEVGIDLSQYVNGEFPVTAFLRIAKELLFKHHKDYRFYLFVDELVFSKLDAYDDEVRIRAAMVRDIFRTSRLLNNYFVEKDLDFHVICSVRPEIRNLINDLDAEIGKIFDGKSVDLTWDMSAGDESLLFSVFKQKVIHSKVRINVNFGEFVDKTINFGNKTMSLSEFIVTNSWSRPRDIVQLLNSISVKNPNSDRIGESEIKNALNEYSRRTMMEIMEEVSVRHGPKIASTLRETVTKREFNSYAEFDGSVMNRFKNVNKEDLLSDLFNFGVIGNKDDKFKSRRYYWFHRGEEFFKKELGVVLHPGLWNYFNIR